MHAVCNFVNKKTKLMSNERKSENKPRVPFARKGFHTVTPFLIVDGAMQLLEFMKKAFDAELEFISKSDEGSIIHAFVRIGDSTIMIADTMEGMKAEAALLYLYVKDVEDTFRRACDAGGTVLADITNQFYGDRAGGIRDQWGNSWWIGTQIEELSDDELDKRARQAISIRVEA